MPGFDNWIPRGHESEVLLKMREVRANALGPRGRACEERGEKREAAVMRDGGGSCVLGWGGVGGGVRGPSPSEHGYMGDSKRRTGYG